MKINKNGVKQINKWGIYTVDLGECTYKEGTVRAPHLQHKVRPCLVFSNQMGLIYGPIATVIPLSRRSKRNLPTHIPIIPEDLCDGELDMVSYAICEQIRTVSKDQILSKVGILGEAKHDHIIQGVLTALGL